MKLALRRGLILVGACMAMVGLVVSSFWVGFLGLVVMLVAGWWKESFHQAMGEDISPKGDTELAILLRELHELVGSMAASLLVFGGNEKTKEALLSEWQASMPTRENRERYKALLQQMRESLGEERTHDFQKKREQLVDLQKAFYKMPYLRILLLNVIEKTEEATNTLIGSFISVSEKNKQALEEVQQKLVGYGGDSLAVLLKKSEEITESYQKMREEYESIIKKNTEQAAEFDHYLKGMFAELKNIGEILGQNKVIAVNLSIEGVKFGEKGKAIKVIVNEIQKLNQKIDQFTEEIMHRLKQFENFHTDLLQTWNIQMSRSVEEFQKASENATLLIQKLDMASRHMVDITGLLQENAKEVQKDLDAIVESLQFQDITRQQIENVMAYLGQIQDDIKRGGEVLEMFGLSFDEWDMDKMDEAKADMVREAKVSSERFLLK